VRRSGSVHVDRLFGSADVRRSDVRKSGTPCILAITKMVTGRNFEAICNKFNAARIRTSDKYAQKYVTKLYNYTLLVLLVSPYRPQYLEESGHRDLFQTLAKFIVYGLFKAYNPIPFNFDKFT
jgi:hypothetical protein